MFRYLLLFATINVAAFAQAILPTTVSAQVSAPLWRYFASSETRLDNPDFPTGLSLSFSFTLNVPQKGVFWGTSPALESLAPTPFRIGTTDFTTSDVGAVSCFSDGQLLSFWIGGVLDGIGGVSSNWVDPYPSDFSLAWYNKNSSLFYYQVNGYFSQLRGTDFDFIVSTSMSQPVPEASTTGVGAGVLLLGLILVRKYWPKKTIRAST